MPDNRLTTLNAVHLSETTKDWAEALNDNFAELDERKTDIGDTSTLVHDGSYVHTDNNYTIAEKNKLAGVATGAQVNVLEGVKVNGTALAPTNKVVDVTVPTKDSDLATNDRYVRYDNATQGLTDAQKSNARTNIGAGTYSKPSGGIPASDLAESYYLASNPNGYTSNQGTVTSVGAGTGLSISGTETVNPTVNIASTHKLPTTTEYNALATKDYVDTAIDNLPEPMVFKGTLGTGGTITTLPAASASNEGFTYKVITDGTYASQAAKVGDVFVSNGSAWVLIPSGDDIEDTWRAINVNGTQLKGNGITSGAINFKNGGNVTVTGSGDDITLGVASGYSIPSTTQQTAWTNKQDALDAQTAYTSKGTSTKVPQITTNSLGQVTGITEVDISYPEVDQKVVLSFDATGWTAGNDGYYTKSIATTKYPINCFNSNNKVVMATLGVTKSGTAVTAITIESDEPFAGYVVAL